MVLLVRKAILRPERMNMLVMLCSFFTYVGEGDPSVHR